MLHAAFSPLYDVFSASFPLYDAPSTVLVSWCDTAVLRTSLLYDVPSTVLVSWCDTAVLRTASSLCHNIPSTVLFPRSPNTLATTRQASVNSDNLVTLTVRIKPLLILLVTAVLHRTL